MTDLPDTRVGLIGYGEVGRIFGRGLVERGIADVAAYDILLHDLSRSAEMRKDAASAGVRLVPSIRDLLEHAKLVISAVTASESLNAARSATAFILPGAYFLDINSASPRTKAESGALIEAAGAHYVESAVMTSVPPHGIGVPMLLGGTRAAELAPLLAALGFSTKPVSETLGVASAIKMCRSVIIKGMEAIVIESFLSARRYEIDQYVLDSLAETFPEIDWQRVGGYFFERVAQHGRRRAEEMREAAATVREAGLQPFMAAATADRQGWMGALAAEGTFANLVKGSSWREYADAILRRFETRAVEHQIDRSKPIPSTLVFDLRQSHRGYRLNRLCDSLNVPENRAAFKADEEGYLERFGLTEKEKALIRRREWAGLIEVGVNIYYLLKLGAVTGHGLYRMGAQMRGESYEEFLSTRNVKGAV